MWMCLDVGGRVDFVVCGRVDFVLCGRVDFVVCGSAGERSKKWRTKGLCGRRLRLFKALLTVDDRKVVNASGRGCHKENIIE